MKKNYKALIQERAKRLSLWYFEGHFHFYLLKGQEKGEGKSASDYFIWSKEALRLSKIKRAKGSRACYSKILFNFK
jgi:hypothetical protein